ncbi:hypothetical protein QL285_007800 [Trifolium repens]|nr:hypothetical protein QL285_007800 [Trifolium repens]
MLLHFRSKEKKEINLADELAGDDWHIKSRSSLMFFESWPLHAIAFLVQSYNICEALPHLKARRKGDKDIKLIMQAKLPLASSGSMTVKTNLATTRHGRIIPPIQ